MAKTTKRDKSAEQQYRSAIRAAWLGVAVMRKKLTTHETRLIADWCKQEIPVQFVVEAIRRTIDRAKAKRLPLYSLGIIRSDLLVVLKERARMHIGGRSPEPAEEWRSRWAAALEEVAEGERNPERASMYRELLGHLPTLTREDALRRYREIENP